MPQNWSRDSQIAKWKTLDQLNNTQFTHQQSDKVEDQQDKDLTKNKKTLWAICKGNFKTARAFNQLQVNANQKRATMKILYRT